MYCTLIVQPKAEENQVSPLELAAYAEFSSLSTVRVSPDGQHVMFHISAENKKGELVVSNIASGEVVARTALSDVNFANAYFIDKNRVIVRASEFKKPTIRHAKMDVSSAFILDINTNKIRQLLIPGYGIYNAQWNLGTIASISDDKKYAYMPAFYNASDRMQEIPTRRLMKVNLTKKAKPIPVAKIPKDTITFFADGQGKVVVRELYDFDNEQHYVQANQAGEWVDIYREATPYMKVSFKGLTSDRSSIIMLRPNEHGRAAYYTISLSTGEISESLFAHENADIAHVVKDINNIIHGVIYSNFTESYAFFDKKLERKMRSLQKTWPTENIYLQDISSDKQSLIVFVTGNTHPGDYYLLSNNSLQHIGGARPHLSSEHLHPVKQTSFKARDGLTIPTLITYPNTLVGKANKLPAVILPHGGPAAYDRVGYDWLVQFLANKGLIVIQPQFRGSTGFGEKHKLAGYGEWGNKMQNDLTDAVAAFVQTGEIDADRVCITGASYGGYAALSGATFTPKLYQCAISMNGPSDLNEQITIYKKRGSENKLADAYWKDNIGDGEYDEAKFAAISPINHIDKISMPILLIHGEDDAIVPYEQSENMYEKLEDANKSVEFITIPDVGHNLGGYYPRLKVLKTLDKFLDKHLSL